MTPVVTDPSTQAQIDGISIMTSGGIFTASSSSQQGSFYLKGNGIKNLATYIILTICTCTFWFFLMCMHLEASENFYGSVNIDLLVTGTSSYEFVKAANTSFNRISVIILSTASPLPAPRLLKSVFSDSGGSAAILFDSPTNIGKISLSSWSCDNVFFFLGASQTFCSWVNNSAVKVTRVRYISISLNVFYLS